MYRRPVAVALVAILGGSSLSLVAAAPSVQALTCSPGIADARKADVTITCALRVIDKDSDIDYAMTRLVSPSGKFSLPLFFDGKKSFGLTSYTGANLAATTTIPRHAEPGYWQLDFGGEHGLKVVSKKGEQVMVGPKEAKDLGLARIVKVYSPDDKTLPYIKDVACTTPLLLNTTRTDEVDVNCRFTVVDTGSGPSSVRASFISPNGDAMIHLTADVVKDMVSNKNGEIVLSASVPAFAGMPGGRWVMITAAPLAPYVTDRNLNGFSYQGVDTEAIWTRPWFEIASVPDVTPPVVQKFGCSATQVIVPYAGEDTYSCQLVVQDDLSGFAYGELAFENPDRNSTAVLRFDANTRQVQFARGGIYAPTLSFDPTAPGGMWTVNKDGLVLRDLAGNTIKYNPKELNDRSYPTFLLVSKTDTPPVVDKKSPAPAVRASYSLLFASLLAVLFLRR